MVAERGVDAHAVGNRRAGWRVIARVEQKNAQQAAYAREYFVKAEAELPEIFGGIFALMEKKTSFHRPVRESRRSCTSR